MGQISCIYLYVDGNNPVESKKKKNYCGTERKELTAGNYVIE